jgi:hypothetical protein
MEQAGMLIRAVSNSMLATTSKPKVSGNLIVRGETRFRPQAGFSLSMGGGR